MKVRLLALFVLAVTAAAAAHAAKPEAATSLSDARWEVIPVSAFGKNGLKVDKLTGAAQYLERVDKSAQWQRIPGPRSEAALKTLSYRVNYQVTATAAAVYLVDVHGGESWRLADNRGKPYWRRIN